MPDSVKPTAKGANADAGAGAAAGVVSQNAPLNPAPVAADPAVLGEGLARPASAPEPGAAAALPEAQDRVWERPVAEPAFAAFQDWVRRYQSAPTPAARAALESEGIELARARRTALADLIQSNPERALQLAVPRGVSGSLPGAVAQWLEEQVTARGDYQVMGVLPWGAASEKVPSVVRGAQIAGVSYEVFTYGKGLTYVSHRDVPLNGIALDVEAASQPPTHQLLAREKLLALNPIPFRVLESSERPQALQSEPVCSVSGQRTETAVQLGTEIHAFCMEAHAAQWAQMAAAGLSVPSGDPASAQTAASPYSEGRKRMLLMRPIWSDYPTVMSTNDALTHFHNFSNYMYEMSQGQLVLAGLGRGSDISPPLLLPGTVGQYDNTGLGALFNNSRTAATAAGYDLTQYDFTYVCTAARPAADYAGLGFIGQPGFHLAHSAWGPEVACHEFGHNLGLNHAHFWDTDLKSMIGVGQNVEYGDGDDPMGGGGSPNSYNSRYRNYLGWIPDSDIVDLKTAGSGQYRLYAFDLDNSVGLRGLKFQRNATQNYWIQYRARKPGQALTNGFQVLWTGNDNEGSYLVDVRLKGVSDNNAVVIGRTFSDPALSLHITPLRKGHTLPESIDVRVVVGASPGNLAPTVVASVNLPNAAVGQAVTFSATASDPNGDPLAYFWEFSDGGYSVDNSAVTTHAFTAAGEYTAQCTASDMKGGTARHTVVVRVGNPATFRVSGHVVDASNRALPGIRLTTDSGRVIMTDNDGSYVFAGLAAGSYRVEAIEPVTGSLTFLHPSFNFPVAVGPNAPAKDFIGLASSLVVSSPLLAKAATGWKYLDTGVDQGTAWRASTFNDSGWATGQAPLGYPSGAPITTVIGYGPNPASKYITYYFRHPLVVTNPSSYVGVNVEVLRDDGAVVYLNGTEVFRNNMPAGTVAFGTLASKRLDAADYIFASINDSLLVPGTNVIAAEIHQADGASSDITMDVGVNGQTVTAPSGLHFLYVSSPPDKSVFTTPASILLNATAFTSVGSISLVEFFANGIKIGEAATAPYSFTWPNPATNRYAITAVATVAGGSPLTSPPVSISVTDPPAPSITLTGPDADGSIPVPTNLLFEATVAPAGATISTVQLYANGVLAGEDLSPPYSFNLTGTQPGEQVLSAVARTSAGSSYTSAPVNVSLVAPLPGTQLVSFGDTWKYMDDGSNLGTIWTTRNYDDRLWPAGPGRLGYGGDGELTMISSGAGLPARPVTVYFRKSFVVPTPALFSELLLQLVRDDGAVVYLNGAEVLRDNLLPGVINWNSLALTAVEGAAESTPVQATISANRLIPGTNVLAVEIHQVNLASTDLGFDLALVGLQASPPPQVYLTQPADGAKFFPPANVTLTTYTGTGPAPGTVTYRVDGGVVGVGASAAPYMFVWNNAPQGTHVVDALADFGGGQVLASPSVTITVGPRGVAIQPFFTTMIPAGSNWRYWDNAVAVGAGWAGTNFNDSSWPQGIARFGWGLDGERTPLTEGRVTTYFRRWFSFPNPGVLSEMVFQLARDDGAVVYLNGNEVYRSNMPGGVVNSSTLALNSVTTPDETTYFETTVPVSGSGILVGSNLVAVELHQGSTTSSDGGFDLQLLFFGTTEPRVYLTTPLQSSTYPPSGNSVLLQAIARGAAGSPVTSVEFFADGVKFDERLAEPWETSWDNVPVGPHTVAARSHDQSGVTVDSPPVGIAVGRTILNTTLIATNSTWKYLVSGINQGTAWTGRTFNDAAWPSGAARLGYGGDGEQTTLSFGGNPNAKFITTYFRKAFVIPAGAVYTTLEFHLVRDDGAVVWLNGRELYRSNMPTTPITFQTLAATSVSGLDEQTPFVTEIANPNLVIGTNVLAVEMHQAAANSSDLGFNLAVYGNGYLDAVPPPRLTIEFTENNIELSWPDTAPGYRVLETPALPTPNPDWTVANGSLVDVSGRFVFTIPAPAGNRFYRLSKP